MDSGLRRTTRFFAPNQNIENNPMQSNEVPAGMDALHTKTFDVSGKSPAPFQHRAT
jgi:hypothetical protein